MVANEHGCLPPRALAAHPAAAGRSVAIGSSRRAARSRCCTPSLRRPEKRAVRQAVNFGGRRMILSGAAVLFGATAAVPLFAAMSAYWASPSSCASSPRRTTPARHHRPRPRRRARALRRAAERRRRPQPSGTAPLRVALSRDAARPRAAARPRWGRRRRGAGGPRGGAHGLRAGRFVARTFLLPAHVGPCGAAGFAAVLLLSVMANDASQYLFGKLFGRTALAPVISLARPGGLRWRRRRDRRGDRLRRARHPGSRSRRGRPRRRAPRGPRAPRRPVDLCRQARRRGERHRRRAAPVRGACSTAWTASCSRS